MAVLIDSSVFVALERRGQTLSALAKVVPDEALALASITASELLVGVHRADSPRRRVTRGTFVEAILETIPVLPFELRIARVHAALFAQLAAAGRPVGAHDLLIGATALAHGSAVLTDNLRDFQRIPGLSVLQPVWNQVK
jgi:predicted nucleic acid-binding protein